MMQAGVDVNEVSGFAGVSVEELERTDWHHTPDFQGNAAVAQMGKQAHNRAQNASIDTRE